MTVYETLVGTSFTAPHVGCVAALLAARGLSSTVIVECPAHDRVEPRPFDPAMGYGIVNASAAVRECEPRRRLSVDKKWSHRLIGEVRQCPEVL